MSREGVSFPIVFSSEYFFSGEINKFYEFPFVRRGVAVDRILIADFLQLLSRLLSNEVIVRAVLTIRNQPEWLSSKYSQASPSIFSASQTDFETRVKVFSGFVDNVWCNWGLVVKKIDEVLGRDNVLVLCMEDVGIKIFWEDLSCFCFGDKGAIPFGGLGEADNKKRVSEAEWGLRRFRPGAFLSVFFNFSPGTFLYSLSRKVDNFLVKLGLLNPGNRDEVVTLTPEICELCKASCGEGNAWLEDRLKKDLSGLGYPVIRS